MYEIYHKKDLIYRQKIIMKKMVEKLDGTGVNRYFKYLDSLLLI